MKPYHALFLIAMLAFFSCEQKAIVEVTNLSGETLTGTIDGAHYIIGSGGTVSQEIEIGHSFIFGTSEKTVIVRGEGWCVLPFSRSVRVENDDVAAVTAYNNAGLITVSNYTAYYVEVYLESCSGLGWGDDVLYSGEYATWRIPAGCYYIEVWLGGTYWFDDTDIVYACTEITYDLSPAASGRLSAAKKQGDDDKVDLAVSLGGMPSKAKSRQLQMTSPEKRLYEVIASSKAVPRSAE